MFELLAEAVSTSANPLTTWGPYAAIILALGGQRGIEALIVAWKGKNGNGGGNSYNKALCDERHRSIDQKLDLLIKHLIDNKHGN